MEDETHNRLRQVAALYWKPLFSLFLGILALPNALKSFFPEIPAATSPKVRIALIALSICAYFIIRFPRIAVAITRWLLGPPPKLPSINNRNIFIGPRPYRSEDSERFFGREKEADDCWREIQEHPFFILEGESGCGKTSLLNAAVLPKARDKYQVVECRISKDPFNELLAALTQGSHKSAQSYITQYALLESLVCTSETDPKIGVTHSTKSLLLCLDQFEELFVTVRDTERERFIKLLRDGLRCGRIRLIVVLRSDFMDLFTQLCHEVDPSQEILDLGAFYILRTFRRHRAELVLDALLKPLITRENPIEQQTIEDFRDQLLQELLRPPRDKRLCSYDEKTVLPVELQIVGMMLETASIKDLSTPWLRRIGGINGLLRAYIEDAKTYVLRKAATSGDQSLLILRKLISPAQTKWVQTPEDIGRSLGMPVEQVKKVLDAFADKYLVVCLPPSINNNASFRYELLHEHFIQILHETPEPILQKAKNAEASLLFWKDRTLASIAVNSTDLSFLARVRCFFAQPIPLLETMRLWPFAQDEYARQMLRRNIWGLLRRVIAMGFAASTLLLIWITWTKTNAYQIRHTIVEAPVEEAAAFGSKPIQDWIIALVEYGMPKEAVKVAQKLNKGDRTQRNQARIQLCAALGATGIIKEAFETASSISMLDSWAKISAYLELAEGLIESNHRKQAGEAALEAFRIMKIKNYSPSGGAERRVAHIFVKLGMKDDARSAARFTLEIARSKSSKTGAWESSLAYIRAAEALAESGCIEEAISAAQASLVAVRGVQQRDSINGQDSLIARAAEAFVTIAEVLLDSGQRNRSMRAARRALDMTQRIKDNRLMYHIIHDVSYRISRKGMDEVVFQFAKELPSSETRILLYGATALALVEVGLHERAEACALQGVALAKNISLREDKRFVWITLIRPLAQIGMVERCDEAVQSALEAIEDNNDPRIRILEFTELFNWTFRAGLYQDTTKIAHKTVESLLAIQSNGYRSYDGVQLSKSISQIIMKMDSENLAEYEVQGDVNQKEPFYDRRQQTLSRETLFRELSKLSFTVAEEALKARKELEKNTPSGEIFGYGSISENCDALIMSGQVLAKVGITSYAIDAAEKAEEVTTMIPDYGEKSARYAGIAKVYAMLHLYERARKTYSKCLPYDRLSACAAILREHANIVRVNHKKIERIPERPWEYD